MISKGYREHSGAFGSRRVARHLGCSIASQSYWGLCRDTWSLPPKVLITETATMLGGTYRQVNESQDVGGVCWLPLKNRRSLSAGSSRPASEPNLLTAGKLGSDFQNMPRSFGLSLDRPVNCWEKKTRLAVRIACVESQVADTEPKCGSRDRIVSKVTRLRTPRRTVSEEA